MSISVLYCVWHFSFGFCEGRVVNQRNLWTSFDIKMLQRILLLLASFCTLSQAIEFVNQVHQTEAGKKYLYETKWYNQRVSIIVSNTIVSMYLLMYIVCDLVKLQVSTSKVFIKICMYLVGYDLYRTSFYPLNEPSTLNEIRLIKFFSTPLISTPT